MSASFTKSTRTNLPSRSRTSSLSVPKVASLAPRRR
ncbi:hypothetical protein BN1708_017183 [Verticillium longisporum]|uniref:Uncharacterized protein n=1 Tax=Verticillium longisporum TaxID=100787 RepID=A0A0G4KUS8_VERLO|nr:hypothetical protein BN1708_017183 [Verticillium longisporum]